MTKIYITRTRQSTFKVSDSDPHGIAWNIDDPHPGFAIYDGRDFIEYSKEIKDDKFGYRWNEVTIKKELTTIKNCEVPEYVRKYLPKIKIDDWYWAIRSEKIVICFRHKKDATAFKKKI